MSADIVFASDPHWIQYVAAFGSVLASVVAVAIALWSRSRENRQRPELSLRFDEGQGHDMVTGFRVGVRQEHWVRLRATNRYGKRSAEDVEVLVLGVQQEEGEGEFVEYELNSYSFTWSNQVDSEGRPVAQTTIPPGVARHFDLLVLREPDGSDGGWGKSAESGQTPASLELALRPLPVDGRHRIGAGTHTILLVLTARDTDAVYYAVQVDFDGRWWDEAEVMDHLLVLQPTRVPWGGFDPKEDWRQYSRSVPLRHRLPTAVRNWFRRARWLLWRRRRQARLEQPDDER